MRTRRVHGGEHALARVLICVGLDLREAPTTAKRGGLLEWEPTAVRVIVCARSARRWIRNLDADCRTLLSESFAVCSTSPRFV